jgi:hypothetical protein
MRKSNIFALVLALMMVPGASYAATSIPSGAVVQPAATDVHAGSEIEPAPQVSPGINHNNSAPIKPHRDRSVLGVIGLVLLTIVTATPVL